MIGYTNKAKNTEVKDTVISTSLGIGVPILLLILWQVLAVRGVINAHLIPPPSSLWKTFMKLLLNGKLLKGLGISFARVLAGFFIGSMAGIVIGFFMGLFERINQALTVIVNVLRPIPTIALIPIFIICFGIGEKANIAVIVVGAFWPTLLNTISGIQSVDKKLLEFAYVYRIKSLKLIFKITLPSAVTSILTGLRLGLGTAWMSVVAAEMIGASSGIGYLIMYSRELAQTSNMYVCVLIIGIVGVVIDRVLLVIQKRCNARFTGNVE